MTSFQTRKLRWRRGQLGFGDGSEDSLPIVDEIGLLLQAANPWELGKDLGARVLFDARVSLLGKV